MRLPIKSGASNPKGSAFYWVRKPPAWPVEVSRKKALASSCERSELTTTHLAVAQRLLTEDKLPVYGRLGMRCRRKIFDAS